MSDPRLTEMSDAEFEALIDGHIERTSAGANEVPADIFVDLLIERFDIQADAPITLTIEETDAGLVITPDREQPNVIVRGNEVLVGGQRLVLRLSRDAA